MMILGASFCTKVGRRLPLRLKLTRGTACQPCSCKILTFGTERQFCVRRKACHEFRKSFCVCKKLTSGTERQSCVRRKACHEFRKSFCVCEKLTFGTERQFPTHRDGIDVISMGLFLRKSPIFSPLTALTAPKGRKKRKKKTFSLQNHSFFVLLCRFYTNALNTQTI